MKNATDFVTENNYHPSTKIQVCFKIIRMVKMCGMRHEKSKFLTAERWCTDAALTLRIINTVILICSH